MKRIITSIFCITCISVIAIAQPGVRIGNLKFIVTKVDDDMLTQINVLDEPCPCPPENEIRPASSINTFKRYNRTTNFGSIGFILPDNSYYSTLPGNSINIDVGRMRRNHFAPNFAIGRTIQYSFYNYKLKDANEDSNFNDKILNGEYIVKNDIDKQVFRSHNVAASLFLRSYLVPPSNRSNDGLYIDLGAQGDFAFNQFYMLKLNSSGKEKYRNDNFNPFSASAIARIGWNDSWLLRSNKRAIFVRYRFTDAFNKDALQKDLPPITIGIQFF